MKPLNENAPKDRRAQAGDTFARTMHGVERLLDAVTPWLLDLGSWIFGGLIAFSLVILGSLLTIGPVDNALKIATASFALALPLDICGFVLLRVFADLIKVRLDVVGTRAFVEEGFSVEGAPGSIPESKLRAVALRYSYGVLGFALLLTLAGVTAALWHMAWWIGVCFAGMVLVSWVIIFAAISALGPQGRWRTPAGEAEPTKASP